MYQPYNEATANSTDRIAWGLCQIIDDDAPLRWTRFRFAAECLARNPALMAELFRLSADTGAKSTDPDQIALDAARKIFDLMRGPELPGGDAQLKARVQLIVLDAMRAPIVADAAMVRRFVDAVNPLIHACPPADVIRNALTAALKE